MANVTIEGVDDAMRVLDEFPVNAEKVIQKAMRKAGGDVVKLLKAESPNVSFRRIIGYKVKARKDGKDFTVMGFMGSKTNEDKQWKFMYAYWKNYGTLANRDSNHKFPNKRKSKSAKWRGGQKPRRFWEKMIRGKDEKYFTSFKHHLKSMAKEVEDAHK